MKHYKLLFFFIILWSIPTSMQAQMHTSQLKAREFNVVPYLNYNNSSGFGFGLVPLLSASLSKQDTVSPRSVFGLVGYYTTKKSYSVLTFGSLYFNQDKWRILYALGFANYNFQTYIDYPLFGEVDFFLPYTTESIFFQVLGRRKIAKDLFIGLGYLHVNYLTSFDQVPDDLEAKLNILQFELLYDSRSNVNYPINGSLVQLRWNNNPIWIGNEKKSNVIIFNANKYIGVQDARDVVALRLHVRAGLGDISFQQQVVLGRTDLRGYSSGKYRGDGMMDLQGEYRWNFPNSLRLSLVGFAGAATLYGSDVEENNWKFYPSIGAGIRYTALTSTHTNIGVDFGFGKDDWGIYFRFNEAY